MLKKFLKRITDFKKLMLVFKAAVLIVAFIFVGSLIAWQTGITDQLSKIFYWPERGLVAGEYEVRAAQAANGCTLYVATNGSDSNSGRSLSAAFQTIQKAADTAVPGDMVCVKAGTYKERLIPANSGTSEKWIKYLAYPGDERKVTIDGSDYTSNNRDYGLVDIRAKSYIEVSGFRIINSIYGTGVWISVGSKYITIKNNYIYNTAYNGVGSWGYLEYRVITKEYANDHIIIEGNEVERAVFNASSGEMITISNTTNFVVKNNYVHDVGYSGHQGGGEGIDTRDGSAYGEVSYNHIHDVRRIGIYADSFDGYTHDIKYFGNIIHNVGAGIMLGTELGNLLENLNFYNNILYNNVSGFAFGGLNLEIPGINPQSPSPIKNIKIINNTFYNNKREGIVSWNSDTTNIVIRNNIFSNKKANCQICSIANATIDHNLIDGPGDVKGADYIEGDPLFVDPESLNFHLSSNSPAIDKGSLVDAPGNDYDNNPRPQGAGYDIGAYEYGAGGSPPPSCTCSSWQDQGCGQGGCNQNQQNQMSQTRTCTPSGCASASQCVTDASCDNSNNGGDVSSCWDPVKGHCYPRIGALHWEASATDWDSKFDLLVLPRGSYLPSYAQKVKSQNPNIIILPSCDINQGHCLMRDEWRLRDSKGNLFTDYWKINYTDFTTFNQNIGAAMTRGIDFSIFDGIATDGLWMNGYDGSVSDIDLNGNGVNDYSEHNWYGVREQLSTGAIHTAENIRQALGNDKLLFINSGTSHTEALEITNGLWWEHNKGSYNGWQSSWNRYQDFMSRAKEPHIMMINAFFGPKENYKEMNFQLGITLLGDGYFDNDVIYNHHGVNWYDEMSINLGYPIDLGRTGPLEDAQIVPGTNVRVEYDDRAVYARFFDNGVSLVNVTGKPVTITDSQLRQLPAYNGPYYRFQGGQNPGLNNGIQFSSITLDGWQEQEGGNFILKGDGIILTKEPTTMVSDIYINNGLVGTSPGSNQTEFIGSWEQMGDSLHTCREKLPSWDIDFYPYGQGKNATYPYAMSQGGNNQAIFSPTISVAGEYEVFEWHGGQGECNCPSYPCPDAEWQEAGNVEATNVQYTITHANGSVTKEVNQQENQSQWNSLGKYTFNQGISGNVTISSQGANGIVIADAIKFVYQGNFGNIKGPPGAQKHLVADFNCDNQVNIQDFGILLSHWQKTQTQGIMDYKHSNCKEKRPIEIAPMNNSCALTSAKPIIDAIDIGMLLSCWGTPKDDGGSCCWKE